MPSNETVQIDLRPTYDEVCGDLEHLASLRRKLDGTMDTIKRAEQALFRSQKLLARLSPFK